MTERDALYRAVMLHPDDDTPRLVFADYLDENGEGDRAEFIRTQIELPTVRYDGCCDRVGNGLEVSGTQLKVVRCGCRRSDLLHRERDLFNAHGAEWFGANAVLEHPVGRLLEALEFFGQWRTVPARGFPAHWYGSWAAWVGEDECHWCNGIGGISRHEYDAASGDMEWTGVALCPAKCANGRVPGVCDTLAWRPTWTMECPECKGEGRIESPNPQFTRRCPKCEGQSGGDDYRCSGRVPRPCPPGAVPLMDVTLTTMPTQSVFPQDRMEGRLEGCSQWHPIPRGEQYDYSHRGIAATLLAAEWPGLRFHLPGKR